MEQRLMFPTAVVVMSFVGAIAFAVASFYLPPGNSAILASLAFNAIGLLGAAMLIAFRAQERRVAALEEQLRCVQRAAVGAAGNVRA